MRATNEAFSLSASSSSSPAASDICSYVILIRGIWLKSSADMDKRSLSVCEMSKHFNEYSVQQVNASLRTSCMYNKFGNPLQSLTIILAQ